MKTVLALLAVLAVAAVSVSVKGQTTDETWVSNQSKISIRASTEYAFLGNSQFQNRFIPPGTAQMDEYSWGNCNADTNGNPVGVTLWIDGSSNQQQIWIPCNASIVGENNPDGTSVDIYYSVFNEINTPTGSVLVTLTP